jgi:heterodisulfide reductase subunit C
MDFYGIVKNLRRCGMEKVINVAELDPNFKYEVAKRPGGENIKACFACGTCSAGCPVREIDDKYNPRKIIRMVLLGMRERVLSSDFIWLCSTCYTCYERCPQDVRLVEVMNVLKNMAAEAGYLPGALTMQMKLLKDFGRLYEIDDFDNRKRIKLGLPSVKMHPEEISKIIEVTGGSKFLKEGGN